MGKSEVLEKILWSIALPGCGQLLNGKKIKVLVFLALEFLINQNSGLNKAIIASLQGEIDKSVELTDYQWLMYYPCFYMFSIYDAYRDAAGSTRLCSTLPYSFAAFLATVGVIYSTNCGFLGLLF